MINIHYRPPVSEVIPAQHKPLVRPTKQVVPGQGVEDARGSDEVAHGGGESGGVHPDRDEGVPDVDVSEETVIPLEQDTVKVWRLKRSISQPCKFGSGLHNEPIKDTDSKQTSGLSLPTTNQW